MWEILLSNADWDCFRTLTLREILNNTFFFSQHFFFSQDNFFSQHFFFTTLFFSQHFFHNTLFFSQIFFSQNFFFTKFFFHKIFFFHKTFFPQNLFFHKTFFFPQNLFFFHKRYKPVPVENLQVYSHDWGSVSNAIVCSSHARHVSIWCDCFCVVRCVNTTHPEPEIHEQMCIIESFGTMCTTPSTFSTTLNAM